MRKKTKEKLLGILITLVIAIVIATLNNMGVINIEEDAIITSKFNNTLYEVTRVVDGDTIVVKFNGKEEKVRLIGVDTPESVHPIESKNSKEGITASTYTNEMLSGKKVALEFDVNQRDKYGRLLAYVYIDGIMYNKTLLEMGIAKVATYPPNVKYVEEFTRLQTEARQKGIGMWQD